MSFAAPVWLLIGLAAVSLLAMAFRAADRRRRRDLERFASHQLIDDLTASASPVRRRFKRSLLLAATALCFLALAGPEIGFTWEETHRRGIDVMIAVDVSRSMLAQDVVPDRLDRAKLAVADLLERLGGDRVGLIAFAGTAFLQCPLTLDDAAFRRALDALQPGIIPAPGSDLASALEEAVRAFSTEARNVKILVLFSDGEDLSGGAVAAAKAAAEASIRVFTVGVGTPAGELIPVKDDDGSTGFVKDAQGQIVKSRLDEATLREVAEATGGFYVPLGHRNEGVAAIVEQALAPIPKEELASKLRRVPQNRYQWPLGLALLLLLIEPFLGERRRAAKVSAPARPGAAAAMLVAAVAIPALARAESTPEEAQALYEQEKYAESLEAWRSASQGQDDPRLDFNLGAAAYRNDEFPEAAEAFARVLRAEDEALRENGFYNLGNAQFRLGQKSRETNPQQTAEAWQQAIDSYDAALRLDEKDEDARANRDLVAKLLEELRQQQEQPQDQDQKKDQEEKQEEQESQSKEPQEQPPPEEQQEGESGDQEREQPRSSPQPGESEESEGKDDEQDEQRSAGAPTPTPARADPKDDRPSPGGDAGSQGKPDEPSRAQTNPAQMSPEEARELLESLSADDEMRPMPLAPEQSVRAGAQQDERDW